MVVPRTFRQFWFVPLLLANAVMSADAWSNSGPCSMYGSSITAQFGPKPGVRYELVMSAGWGADGSVIPASMTAGGNRPTASW
jgi:hypothetical protein